MRIVFVQILVLLSFQYLQAQSDHTKRSTLYFIAGSSGANVREFNEMLQNKGVSPLRSGYSSTGLGYQYRFNDFILGFELYHNNGPKSLFREYEIDHRTTRFYANIGYSLTEEGRFHLVHYMSIGAGYLNFQMLKDERRIDELDPFLQNPSQGFVLRKNDIQKGTHKMGGFLTEIGFQVGYDFDLPGMEETLELLAKFGYAFSPFEDSWSINGINFDNLQSGAFFRMGAGISMPDRSLFFPDAALGIHFFYGMNFRTPTRFNELLEANGMQPLARIPGNLGIKVIGENRRRMYGVDVFNIANKGPANEQYDQTLNSLRFYFNYGYLLFKKKNVELGGLGGIGYGNIRYTLEHNMKPDFPLLFEEPDFDGYLSNRGIMAKPEIYLAYAMPLNSKMFNLVYSAHFGYELPLSRYRLGGLSMANYMSGPYLQFGLGIRP